MLSETLLKKKNKAELIALLDEQNIPYSPKILKRDIIDKLLNNNKQSLNLDATDPVVDEPVAEPVVDEPVVAEPVVAEPVVDEPVAG